MIKGGVTAGILGSAITPTSAAAGKKRLEAGGGEARQPHGWSDHHALSNALMVTGVNGHTDRVKRSTAFMPQC
jgi:hypothetical protein